jgi:molybdopterin molybdotransferase
MGHSWKPPLLRLPTAERLARKNNDRLGWIPVGINMEGKVVSIDYHGSAHIFALKDAQGIASLPVGTLVIEKGELVDVRPV